MECRAEVGCGLGGRWSGLGRRGADGRLLVVFGGRCEFVELEVDRKEGEGG